MLKNTPRVVLPSIAWTCTDFEGSALAGSLEETVLMVPSLSQNDADSACTIRGETGNGSGPASSVDATRILSVKKPRYKRSQSEEVFVGGLRTDSSCALADHVRSRTVVGERLSAQAERLRSGLPRRALMRDRDGNPGQTLSMMCEELGSHRDALANSGSSASRNRAKPAKAEWSPVHSFRTMIQSLPETVEIDARCLDAGIADVAVETSPKVRQSLSAGMTRFPVGIGSVPKTIHTNGLDTSSSPQDRIMDAGFDSTAEDHDSAVSSMSRLPMNVENSAETSQTVERRSQRLQSAAESDRGAQTVLFRFPEQSTGAVTITLNDLCLLQPGGYLNDNVIDFWLKFLERYRIPCQQMTRLQFMSTFFYKKITSIPQRSRGDTTSTDELFESIAKRWLIARGVDLFTKKMVFVPVHHEFHWSVAVLCNLDAFLHGWSTGSDPESKQRPCILYLDSVRPASPGGMTKALRSFLAVYARARQTALFSPGHCRPSRRGAASSSTMHLAAVLNPPQPESTESAFMPLTQECRQDEMEDSTVATDVIDVICGDSNSTPLMTRKHAFHAELDETSDVLPQTTGLVFDGDSLPLLKPKVPLQENSMDCGIYTLMYVEYLATKWPESYQLDRLNQRTSELFGTSDVDAYRMEIERVVRCLAHSQGIENLPESVCYDIDAADMEDA